MAQLHWAKCTSKKSSFVNPVFRGVIQQRHFDFQDHISGAIYVDLLHKCCNYGTPFIGRLTYIHLTAVSALLSPLCCFRFVKARPSVPGRRKGMREQDLWIKGVIISIQEHCAAVVPSLCWILFVQQAVLGTLVSMTWNTISLVVHWQTQFLLVQSRFQNLFFFFI